MNAKISLLDNKISFNWLHIAYIFIEKGTLVCSISGLIDFESYLGTDISVTDSAIGSILDRMNSEMSGLFEGKLEFAIGFFSESKECWIVIEARNIEDPINAFNESMKILNKYCSVSDYVFNPTLAEYKFTDLNYISSLEWFGMGVDFANLQTYLIIRTMDNYSYIIYGQAINFPAKHYSSSTNIQFIYPIIMVELKNLDISLEEVTERINMNLDTTRFYNIILCKHFKFDMFPEEDYRSNCPQGMPALEEDRKSCIELNEAVKKYKDESKNKKINKIKETARDADKSSKEPGERCS